jgi:hypothetical protein
MTRKDYILLAAAFADALESYPIGDITERNYGAREALQFTARRLSYVLADENPRFDRAKFLTACEVGGVDNATL